MLLLTSTSTQFPKANIWYYKKGDIFDLVAFSCVNDFDQEKVAPGEVKRIQGIIDNLGPQEWLHVDFFEEKGD